MNIFKGGESVTQVLVHWKNKSLEEDMGISGHYGSTISFTASLHLGDKVVFQGVDIDGYTNRAKTWSVYESRNKKTSLTNKMAKKNK